MRVSNIFKDQQLMWNAKLVFADVLLVYFLILSTNLMVHYINCNIILITFELKVETYFRFKLRLYYPSGYSRFYFRFLASISYSKKFKSYYLYWRWFSNSNSRSLCLFPITKKAVSDKLGFANDKMVL